MATATPDTASDEFEREARLEDRQTVLDLDSNLYGGTDYLPYHYDEMLIDPDVTSYVYEKQGKVVGFLTARQVDGGQTLFTSLGRVGLANRGEGLYGRFKRRVFDRWRGHPGLRHVAMVVSNDNMHFKAQRLLKDYTIVMEKEITPMDVDLKQIRSLKSSPYHSQPFHMMTYDDVKCMMSHDPVHVRHLFPEERILVGWCPLRIMEDNSNLFFNGKRQILANTTLEISRMRGTNFPVTLMTVGDHYSCKLGQKYVLDVYGDGTDEELRLHLEWHLRSFVQTCFEETGRMFVYCCRRVDHIVQQLQETFGLQLSDIPAKKMFVLEMEFGITMATAAPNATSEEFEREATLEDRQAVLDLDSNVHFGTDYLLYHYDKMLTDPDVTSYVYEKQGKVVGFTVRRVDGGQTLFTSLGRMGLANRGEGLYGRFTRRVFDRWRGHPGLRHVAMTVNDVNMHSKAQRLLKDYTIVMEKELTSMEVNLKQIRSLTSSQNHSLPFHMMTYDDVKCMMSHDPIHLRHLFPEERILLQWCPLRIMKENTKILFNGKRKILANTTSEIGQTRGTNFPVTLMTTGDHYSCKLGRAYDLDVYGDGSDEELGLHLEWHLRSFVETCPDETGMMWVNCCRRVDHIVPRLQETFGLQKSDIPLKKVFALEMEFGQ